MRYKIPFIKPHFPDAHELVADFQEIQQNNWFTNFGPFETKLCLEVSKLYSDSVHVTTIANATLGLQAAIDILIKPQGEKVEVIVPSFTFAAGPEMLIKSGLRPVFIDIEKSSLQPSFQQASHYLHLSSDKVAGILLCNTFGVGNSDIESWESLAKSYQIPLIIDSAAGFGSKYQQDEILGARGDCEIFSMHATKPFAVGEGGLVVSKNPALIQDIRSYQNFGFNADKNIQRLGTNAKLQEFNCVIGLRQLKDYDNRLEGRRNILRKYKEVLQPKGFLFMENDERSTVCFASVIAPNSQVASDLLVALNKSGVEARKYYSPLHEQSILSAGSRVADTLANTTEIYSRILSLPVHDHMADEDIEFTTRSILENVS